MNTQRIAPATKMRRGSEHYLNGNPVYIERDRGDGTVLISDSKQLRPEDNYWNVNKSDLSLQPKYKTTLKVVKGSKPGEDTDKNDLNAFFDSFKDKVPFNCANCRKPLYAFNKSAKRASCAHILPKSVFPSIAKNPDNIVFLGVDVFGASCYCHSQYDSSVEKRVKMPIYETVLKRFELLKPHLNDHELGLAEEYLGLRAKSQNLSKDITEGRA